MVELKLVDCTPPIEPGEAFPEVTIDSEQRLREELEWWRQQAPSIIRLDSPDGESLLMGIGGPLAALRWTKPPSKLNMKMPIADPIISDKPIEFLFQGQEMGFRSIHVILVSQAIDIAVYYFKNHQLPGWIQWREWNG
jgi:hypothetical protein